VERLGQGHPAKARRNNLNGNTRVRFDQELACIALLRGGFHINFGL
jgi:hypothetical protein